MGLGAQAADDVAQALQAGQLSQAGGRRTALSGSSRGVSLLVPPGLGVEFMSGKQVEKLFGKTCGMMSILTDLEHNNSISHRGSKPPYF